MTRFAVLLVLFTLVYTIMLSSYTAWDFLIGAGLSAIFLLFDRPVREIGTPSPGPSLWYRLLWAPIFAAAVIVDITLGTFTVMLIALRLRPLGRAGIVRIPIGRRTPLGVLVSTLALSLSPGSALVKIDAAGGVIWIHVIDAADPDAVRQQYQDFYDRYQRHVFP